MGEETARRAWDHFQFEPLGEIGLRGLTKGMPAYRVKMDAKGTARPGTST